jgi:CRISPR-associated endoribonuclease Cas6
MRLKLTLRPESAKPSVPVNYHYPLSATIYKLLAQASPEYSTWLHERGYRSPADRLLKLFTFSKLDIPRVKFADGVLVAHDVRAWRLLVSSPMTDEFVQLFVLGLFQNQKLEIGGRGAVGRFLIEQVEALAPPEFTSPMRFKTLSPVVVSTMREHKGKLQPYYYRPNDLELGAAIRQNLLEKFETIQGCAPQDGALEVAIDNDYMARRGGPEKVSKLITIKEGTPEETRIKGFECPLLMKGSQELMQVAWECGVGDHNSMGCGMVEVV